LYPVLGKWQCLELIQICVLTFSGYFKCEVSFRLKYKYVFLFLRKSGPIHPVITYLIYWNLFVTLKNIAPLNFLWISKRGIKLQRLHLNKHLDKYWAVFEKKITIISKYKKPQHLKEKSRKMKSVFQNEVVTVKIQRLFQHISKSLFPDHHYYQLLCRIDIQEDVLRFRKVRTL